MIYYQYDESGLIIARIEGAKTAPVCDRQFTSDDPFIESGKVYEDGKVYAVLVDEEGNFLDKDVNSFVVL